MQAINKSAILLAAALSLAAHSARGQILYSNDFSSTGLPNTSAAFTLDTGSGVLNYVVDPGAANVVSTASVQVSGSAGSDFVVSTRFTINNFGTDTGNNSTFGFGILSSAPDFIATGGNAYYLVDWGLNGTSSAKGQLRILAQPAGRVTFTATNGDSDGVNPNGSSVVNGNTYELRLTGTYTNGTLDMVFALFDESGILLGTVATATDTSPLAGEFFGYRNRAVNTSGNRDVSYDYFSVALPDPTPQPPTFVILPVSQNWLSDADVTFTTSATGAQPIHYQWLFNANPIPEATNTTHVVSNAQPAEAGNYSVIVTNTIGTNITPDAVLTIRPRIENGILTPLWSIAPGERAYLTAADTERGLAYNAASNHVLLLGRPTTSAGPANLFVLNGDTGEDLWQMDTSTVGGGTFWGNLVGVAEDGVVYAANLVANPVTSNFRIYRWATDEPGVAPTLAYDGTMNDIAQRWGDTLAVRGSGAGTQIIVSSLSSTAVAVFTTTDGINFSPVIMNVPDIANGDFTHGLAFGAGDTFWGKARDRSLKHVAFDLNTATATLLRDYSVPPGNLPGGVGPIGVEGVKNLLAGIAVDNPDHVQLYNIANLTAGPALVEQEFLAADNANIRNAGAACFANNRLYVLGTANGIRAFTLDASRVPFWITGVSANGGTVTLQWDSVAGVGYQVQYKAGLSDLVWTDLGSPTNATGSATAVLDTLTGANARFYRVQLVP